MESVLVGVDRSETSRHALEFALKRARINEWKVTVAHVINWSRFSFPTLEENEQRPVARQAELDGGQREILDPLLAWAAENGLSDGVEVETTLRFGRPSEVLADLAEEDGYDAIIVGRTGDSNLKRAIFGSTASRLVQYAPVPVVVVP